MTSQSKAILFSPSVFLAHICPLRDTASHTATQSRGTGSQSGGPKLEQPTKTSGSIRVSHKEGPKLEQLTKALQSNNAALRSCSQVQSAGLHLSTDTLKKALARVQDEHERRRMDTEYNFMCEMNEHLSHLQKTTPISLSVHPDQVTTSSQPGGACSDHHDMVLDWNCTAAEDQTARNRLENMMKESKMEEKRARIEQYMEKFYTTRAAPIAAERELFAKLPRVAPENKDTFVFGTATSKTKMAADSSQLPLGIGVHKTVSMPFDLQTKTRYVTHSLDARSRLVFYDSHHESSKKHQCCHRGCRNSVHLDRKSHNRQLCSDHVVPLKGALGMISAAVNNGKKSVGQVAREQAAARAQKLASEKPKEPLLQDKDFISRQVFHQLLYGEHLFKLTAFQARAEDAVKDLSQQSNCSLNPSTSYESRPVNQNLHDTSAYAASLLAQSCAVLKGFICMYREHLNCIWEDVGAMIIDCNEFLIEHGNNIFLSLAITQNLNINTPALLANICAAAQAIYGAICTVTTMVAGWFGVIFHIFDQLLQAVPRVAPEIAGWLYGLFSPWVFAFRSVPIVVFAIVVLGLIVRWLWNWWNAGIVALPVINLLYPARGPGEPNAQMIAVEGSREAKTQEEIQALAAE